MNPQELFCPARGQVGKGNIHVHSLKDKRCLYDVCGKTFATTSGTIFYRLRTNPVTVMLVLTLLAYGCPVQAIVKAFGLDERTVRDWHQRAGHHCQQVHEHVVENSQHDLEQVQADEIKAKTQLDTLWMAFAIWVPTRLWMGGVVSPKRDLNLIQALADKVRQMALCRPLLLAVDGLASYVSAFRNVFRSKFPRQEGETRRCKAELEISPDLERRILEVSAIVRERLPVATFEGMRDLLELLQVDVIFHDLGEAMKLHVSCDLVRRWILC